MTDLLILNSYYTKEYYTFFYLSLSVIILAQLSYCFAFTILFSENGDSLCVRICTFISSLLFSPFLAIIMYFARDSESKFAKNVLHKTCGLRAQEFSVSKHKSKMTQWLQRKFYKHIGFILEAAFEAFPNSIIQCIAIVYYGYVCAWLEFNFVRGFNF